MAALESVWMTGFQHNVCGKKRKSPDVWLKPGDCLSVLSAMMDGFTRKNLRQDREKALNQPAQVYPVPYIPPSTG